MKHVLKLHQEELKSHQIGKCPSCHLVPGAMPENRTPITNTR